MFKFVKPTWKNLQGINFLRSVGSNLIRAYFCKKFKLVLVANRNFIIVTFKSNKDTFNYYNKVSRIIDLGSCLLIFTSVSKNK